MCYAQSRLPSPVYVRNRLTLRLMSMVDDLALMAGAPAKVVLVIAGSDSSGGAGIQADIKTGAAFGVHVATAITAVTAQNSLAVRRVYALPVAEVLAQIEAVWEAMPVTAIKVGMLANPDILLAVSDWLGGRDLPIVVDPVLGATSGGRLFSERDCAQIYTQHLLPLASVLTPNLQEAAQLLGVPPAVSYDQIAEQAMALQTLGPQAVLLKGGHGDLPLAADYLAFGTDVTPFSTPRIDSTHTHGGGCSLASAIAAGLAQGLEIKAAVAAAKTYIQGAIRHSERLGLAPQNGPIHHFYQYW